MSELTQRTEQWYKDRLGKFTSSRINDLMGIKGLGKTGETYAFELAVQIVEGNCEEEDFESYDMRRGTELEPYAFDHFKQLKKLEFIDVVNCGFIQLNANTGGSPDGLVDDNAVLEIKCPKSNKLFRLVVDGVIDQAYIDQMQHQMWVSAREKAYFFNYCIHNGDPKWHEIMVERDQNRIDLMDSRIKEATIIRDEFVAKLLANKQY